MQAELNSITEIVKSPKIKDSDIPSDFWGWTQEKLLEFCKNSPMPGNNKWPADHPIWDCNVAGNFSPREAWKNEHLLKRAIRNLFWILYKSRDVGPKFYPDFVESHKKAFEEGGVMLLRKVLSRFTISKIAPKVTALSSSAFLNILNDSKLDISNGVYCPMAGFGGIVGGAERWFIQRKLTPNIEAYDINPNFCKYYGWVQRDVLSSKIKTSKSVVACPPFGPNTERWKDTPDCMYYEFDEWCKKLHEYIDAPQYILFGPEVIEEGKTKFKSGKKASGLFNHTIGIKLYTEYLFPKK